MSIVFLDPTTLIPYYTNWHICHLRGSLPLSRPSKTPTAACNANIYIFHTHNHLLNHLLSQLVSAELTYFTFISTTRDFVWVVCLAVVALRRLLPSHVGGRGVYRSAAVMPVRCSRSFEIVVTPFWSPNMMLLHSSSTPSPTWPGWRTVWERTIEMVRTPKHPNKPTPCLTHLPSQTSFLLSEIKTSVSKLNSRRSNQYALFIYCTKSNQPTLCAQYHLAWGDEM